MTTHFLLQGTGYRNRYRQLRKELHGKVPYVTLGYAVGKAWADSDYSSFTAGYRVRVPLDEERVARYLMSPSDMLSAKPGQTMITQLLLMGTRYRYRQMRKELHGTVPDVALGYAVGKARADNNPDLVAKAQRCVESGSWHQQHSQSATQIVERGNLKPVFPNRIRIR